MKRIKQALCGPGAIVFAAVLAVVLTAPALFTGYQVDDWLQHLVLERDTDALGVESSPSDMFRFVDGDPARTRAMMEKGFLPWWTLPTAQLTFWRPITVLTHVVDHVLWPDSVFMMHLHSLVWYGAAVAMAGVYYRKLLAPLWAAGLAALLFAMDDAHAMPAGWIANRNACIAVFWGILALWAHVRWREDGRNEWLTLGLFSLAMSLLAKESGASTFAYLFAYAVFLDPGRRMTRVISMLPYAGVMAVWLLTYRLLGYGLYGSAMYVDPLRSPGDFLLQAFMRAPVLFLGQWAVPPSDLHIALPMGGQWLLWLLGIGAFLLIAGAFAPMFRYDARLRFWALGSGLSMIPACATFPSDRLLMFVGFGACGLIAQFIHARSERKEIWARAPVSRLLAPLAAALLILVHVVLAPILLPARIVAFAALGGAITESIETAPLPPDIADKTLVIANAPNVFFSSYFPVIKAAKGEPVPGALRTLSANVPWPVPHQITRVDKHSVEVRPPDGFRWFLVRNDDHPFQEGDAINLGDMVVGVLEVAPEGWPSKVVYTFEKPLEDPSLVWLVYKANLNRYVPFIPPPVGQSFTIDPYG